MTIKLIAVDLDDSLLRSDGTICPVSADVLRQAVARGCYVIIATSRRLASVQKFSEDLGINNHPIICADGALIMSKPFGDIWQKLTISSTVAIQIAALADANDWELTVVAGDKTYHRQRLGQSIGELEENRFIVANNVDMMQVDEPARILVYDNHSIQAIATYCKHHFTSQIHLQFYYHADDSVRSLGIFPKDADKGIALRYVCERLSIKLEETMAIGDGRNDIPMLKLAGISVVMGNARDVIKSYADAITTSNDDHGVGQAVRKFVL